MVTGDGGGAEVVEDLAEETVATAGDGVGEVIGEATGEAVAAGRENLMRRERTDHVEGDVKSYKKNMKFKMKCNFSFSSSGRGGGFRGGRDRENGRGGPKGGHNGYRE